MNKAGESKSFFKALVSTTGQSIIIHNDAAEAPLRSFETRGVKTWDKANPQQVVFQFPKRVEVRAGSRLQVKGSNEAWNVVAVNEHRIDQEPIYFEVRVVKRAY